MLAMIDVQAICEEFCELVRIDSPSGEEAAVVKHLREQLAEMGLESEVDDAAAKIEGNCGNLIARVPGIEGAPTVLVNAHVDTVQPGRGIKPQVDGTLVTSDGTTVLGGDDKSGVVIILAALRELLGEELPHPPLEVVFTVAEETGLNGAKALDYDQLNAEMGYVLDGGRTMGVVTNAAPSAFGLTFEVKGVAAHAGVCPEEGVNSIQAAAEAIANIPLGRLDFETTSNIGVIEGGDATNIVPEMTVVKGEARSHDEGKLKAQVHRMTQAFAQAGEKYGAEIRSEVQRSYTRFRVGEGEPVTRHALRAAAQLGFEPTTETGGGGSDANIFNEHGIPSVIMATGPADVHTVKESVDCERMAESARWLVATLGLVAAGAG